MDRPAFLAHTAAVEVALGIARDAGTWDAVRMQDVARGAGISLAQLLHDLPDRDAIAEACFDIADHAMLAESGSAGWSQWPVCERLHRAVFAWLAALPPRRIVRGMLGYKLQPEHLHLQAQGAMRISRTVQTMRETALLRATGWRREAEEAALTSIYLAAFSSWLFDDSAQARRTRQRLARWLAFAHRMGGWSG